MRACIRGGKAYLCLVFFIVIEFKVKQSWDTAVSLFCCPEREYFRPTLRRPLSDFQPKSKTETHETF